jgi:hypothetical protein
MVPRQVLHLSNTIDTVATRRDASFLGGGGLIVGPAKLPQRLFKPFVALDRLGPEARFVSSGMAPGLRTGQATSVPALNAAAVFGFEVS